MRAVGRNDPCPCGSGKKYKRCHLLLDKVEGVPAGGDFLEDDEDFDIDDEDERYFGYDERRPQNASPFDLGLEGLVCMVFRVDAAHLAEIQERAAQRLSVGDWVVSTGKHEATVVNGPFRELDEAFDWGVKNVGVVRYLSDLEFG